MPRCSASAAWPLSASELPILPFLAPRIFYPRSSIPLHSNFKLHHTNSRQLKITHSNPHVTCNSVFERCDGVQSSLRSARPSTTRTPPNIRQFHALSSAGLLNGAAGLSTWSSGKGTDGTTSEPASNLDRAGNQASPTFTPNLHDPNTYDKTLFEPTDEELGINDENQHREELVKMIEDRLAADSQGKEGEELMIFLKTRSGTMRVLSLLRSAHALVTYRQFKHFTYECTVSEAVALYDWMKMCGCNIHLPIQRKLVSFLASKGGTEKGLQVIRDIQNSGADITSTEVEHSFERFLWDAAGFEDRYDTCLKILSEYRNMGINITTRMTNLVLARATAHDDLNTALRLFDARIDLELPLDSTSYAILLNFCRRHDAFDALDEVLHAMKFRNEVIVSLKPRDQIEAIYYSRNRDIFITALRVYVKFWSIEPIKALLLTTDEFLEHYSIEGKEDLPSPSSETLFLMIKSWLLGGMTHNTSWIVYEKFHKLLCMGHPDIVPLGGRLGIYNAFLKNFAKNGGIVRYWRKIIRDMEYPMQGNHPKVKGTLIPRCRPSKATWNRILYGVIKEGRARLGMSILAHLKNERGIGAGAILWRGVLWGLARTYSQNKVDLILEEAQAHELAIDEHTLNELLWFRDDPEYKRRQNADFPKLAGGLEFLRHIEGHYSRKWKHVDKSLEANSLESFGSKEY